MSIRHAGRSATHVPGVRNVFHVISLPLHSAYLAAGILPSSYLNITNVMPALTAHMTNTSYPIAYLIKSPEQPIFVISDQIDVVLYVSANHVPPGLS